MHPPNCPLEQSFIILNFPFHFFQTVLLAGFALAMMNKANCLTACPSSTMLRFELSS
ncbi:hypothetical protein GALMADRAFT_256965 [Galerina marginata CBS 339.88]|uniref:Uncharacterized protein n=1 Tax=Galerina marginata (strain CBS 339.88) TaxID=685588 RepID=A0A067SBT6_GALM3|nr:hypothetical protein GALMADRAFT_256965 [Galerina marginata CBS 339.88]